MQIKIFTLPFSDAIQGFDDAPVRKFISGRNVVAIEPAFFFSDGRPHWSILVCYGDPLPDTGDTAKPADAKAADKSYLELLTDATMPLYNHLRDWRKDTANREGVPPYVVFNNRQLAHIVAAMPESLSALSTVEGVGRVKVEKYGKTVLAMLAEWKRQTEGGGHGA